MIKYPNFLVNSRLNDCKYLKQDAIISKIVEYFWDYQMLNETYFSFIDINQNRLLINNVLYYSISYSILLKILTNETSFKLNSANKESQEQAYFEKFHIFERLIIMFLASVALVRANSQKQSVKSRKPISAETVQG